MSSKPKLYFPAFESSKDFLSAFPDLFSNDDIQNTKALEQLRVIKSAQKQHKTLLHQRFDGNRGLLTQTLMKQSTLKLNYHFVVNLAKPINVGNTLYQQTGSKTWINRINELIKKMRARNRNAFCDDAIERSH